MTNLVAGLVLAAASIFGHHMVLQRDMPVPVWGTAAPGEEVTVSVAGQQAKAVADTNGKWMAKLAPLPAGGPFTLEIKAKGGALQFTNVLVGEVWIASGQSNMAMALAGVKDHSNEVAAANFPNLRLFTVPNTASPTPLTQISGSWTPCSPSSAGRFSAVAYFFGRQIHKELGVPVGLIHASWGGTPAEAWTPLEVLKANPALAITISNYEKRVADLPEGVRKFEEQKPKLMETWKQACAKARAEGKTEPLEPHAPAVRVSSAPAALYHGMIHPLIPCAIRGAIWYQGEGNASRAEQYRTLFPAMIRAWRERWGQGDFPFYFVQLANYTDPKAEPGDSKWAELREAQAMTLSLPNTGMATAIDIGDAKTVHPTNKQEVGRRLALAALARTYGKKDLVDAGPTYKSMAAEGASIRISFDNPGGGLATHDGGPPKGFAIAGEDQKFVWADAKIEGETVVLRSAAVPKPVAARYAWADNPDTANVVNKAGLPMFPFRTDHWPMITAAKKVP